MDAKITLRFNASVIEQAKEFAESNNMSLSRLTEYLYKNITSKNYQALEDLPLADWVNVLAEGETEYVTKRKSKKELKDEFYQSKKK